MLLFKKKLTVTGIKGNTQGVIIANKPVPKQIRKILQSDLDFWSAVFTSFNNFSLDAFTVTEKLSTPLGNSVPDLASQVNSPFIFFIVVSEICKEY